MSRSKKYKQITLSKCDLKTAEMSAKHTCMGRIEIVTGYLNVNRIAPVMLLQFSIVIKAAFIS